MKNFDSLTSIQIDILENRIFDQPQKPFAFSFAALYGNLDIAKYSETEVQIALNSLVANDFITRQDKDIYIFSREQFLSARSYFGIENEAKVNQKAGMQREDPMPDKITLAWLFHNVPYKFWVWLVGLTIAAFITGIQSSKLTLVEELFNLQTATNKVTVSSSKTAPEVSDFQLSLVVLEVGSKGATFAPRKIDNIKLSGNLNFVQLYQRISKVIEPHSNTQFPYSIIDYDNKKWVNDFDAPVVQLVKNKGKIIFVSKMAVSEYGQDIDLFLTEAETLF